MIEQNIDVATTDGQMNTFIVHPEENGPHPIVIFFMDAPGKREELHDMARRLASVGYYVILPNLYYRRTKNYYLKERTTEAMAEMFEHMSSLNQHTTEIDTSAIFDFLDKQLDVSKDKVGAVGYCMSGPIVLWAAASFPNRFRSIASIHGANMVTQSPQSPHLMPPHLKCECYIGCAEMDKWAPLEDIQTLKMALETEKVKHRVEWFPQTEHGFVFPQRAGIYHQDSAERHWERLFDLFKRTLT